MPTAYKLLERVYTHHYGQLLSRRWTGELKAPKQFVMQQFESHIEECRIVCATPTAIILDYDGDDTDKKIANADVLGTILVQAGWWLYRYSGHTGDWLISHYSSRANAKVAYKSQYMRYFRCQEWFHIVRVR